MKLYTIVMVFAMFAGSVNLCAQLKDARLNAGENVMNAQVQPDAVTEFQKGKADLGQLKKSLYGEEQQEVWPERKVGPASRSSSEDTGWTFGF